MRASKAEEDEPIDGLVAEYLKRQCQRTESDRLLERIRMSRQIRTSLDGAAEAPHASGPRQNVADFPRSPGGPSRLDSEATRTPGGAVRRSWFAAGTWAVLAGLGLLVAFFGGRQFGPVAANAAGVLRELQVVHQREVDRCYQVQYAPDPQYWNKANPLEGPSHSVLWTRGDRFWSDCSIGDIRLFIGRAADGSLWIRHSPNKGIQFVSDASQLPGEVALLCAANSMTVPRLVDEVLADFELRVDRPLPNSEQTPFLVWASLKPGHSHPLITSAVMEIDPKSGQLVRLVLWMKRDGRPRGTVTYTFLKEGIQKDDQYELQAHLNEGAEIETHRFQP